MKNKKLTVTVGIPAYNEEANIKNLITSILKQVGNNFILEKVIVVSDKSTDKTESIIKSLKSRKLILIKNEIRIGQALSQNIIKEKVNSDVLVLLNADILITDYNFLNKIVEPFSTDPKLGLVCPKALTLPASSLFERVINYGVEMKEEIFESYKKGYNVYTCRGTARAFTKRFFKMFKWPKMVGEDAYTYLSVINYGMKYKFQKGNIFYYKSPSNFTDHRRQSRRFFGNYKELPKYFPRELVKEEFYIPKTVFFKTVFKYSASNPLLFLSYALVTLLANIIPGKKLSSAWTPAASTKKLLLIK